MTKLLKISDKCITAPKYNGGQLYIGAEKAVKKPVKKVDNTICLDWFEVTLSASQSSFNSSLVFSQTPPPSHSDGTFTYEYKGCGSKRYKFIYNVYLDGEKFGTLLTCPRSVGILEPFYCQFKIENHKLYQSGWISDFELLINSMDFSIVSYTRIDVAIDGYEFLDVFNFFQDGSLDRLGRAKYSPYYEKVEGKDRVITGLDWGSKSSDKYMTIYNKSSRIEKENKQYIDRFWSKNGLDRRNAPVERMELKLKSKAIGKIPSFDYKKLDNHSYLASLFRTQIDSWFEFVYPSGDSNKSRRERFKIVDFASMGGVLLEKDSTSPSSEVWSVKLAIKTLFFQGSKGVLDFPVCISQIKRLVAWYGLNDWYLIRSKAWNRILIKESLVGKRLVC